MDNNRIPRKPGQPAKSDKHSDLYTDEDPKGTITGLKFTTAEDAKNSVSKIKNSGRSHAHKIQAAVAMEQRARVMGKLEAASIYRKFINSMKKKTFKQLREKCWDGWTQQGMKKKGDRLVPNCVKVSENFMDGKNPQDKGDMARHGLKDKTISQLKKIRSSDSASKREKQLAHFKINMTQGKRKVDEDLDEGIKQAMAATALAAAVAVSPQAHAQEPVHHPDNPHLIAHVEHGDKVHRFDLEKLYKSPEHAREHLTPTLKKHGFHGTLHISHKVETDSKRPSVADYSDRKAYTPKYTDRDYSDNKPYTPKDSTKDYFSPAK